MINNMLTALYHLREVIAFGAIALALLALYAYSTKDINS